MTQSHGSDAIRQQAAKHLEEANRIAANAIDYETRAANLRQKEAAQRQRVATLLDEANLLDKTLREIAIYGRRVSTRVAK